MQHVRSFLFVVTIFTIMPIMGLAYLIPTIINRNAAIAGCRHYSKLVVALARPIVGIRSEVRGPVPTGAVMIAAKHQSFLDILILVATLDRPRFIMKHELLYAPVLGWYAKKIGCVPVKRGQRGQAIQGMLEAVEKGSTDPGQLIIYPQGTRVPPGDQRSYKIGAGLIYRDLGQPAVPVAVNCGQFWPRAGMLKKPGLAIVEFLEPIPPGKSPEELVATLEALIEPRSDALMGLPGPS